jgi:hypothetical protein
LVAAGGAARGADGEEAAIVPSVTSDTTPSASAQVDSAPSPEETAAAQSILENESLTADLDDAAANALLEWGVANARMVVRSVATLFGDAESQVAVSERLRAVRQMMRAVNAYASGAGGAGGVGDVGEADSGSTLDNILEQAAVVYGRNFSIPSAEQRAAFISTQTALLSNPVQMINNLRRFIEEQRAEGQ